MTELFSNLVNFAKENQFEVVIPDNMSGNDEITFMVIDRTKNIVYFGTPESYKQYCTDTLLEDIKNEDLLELDEQN